jgi:hypothetical protein
MLQETLTGPIHWGRRNKSSNQTDAKTAHWQNAKQVPNQEEALQMQGHSYSPSQSQ